MQFEKLLNDEDIVVLSSYQNILYCGTWKDFNLRFSQIGWEAAFPKGYDNDDLKWYIEEVVLEQKNPYDLYILSQYPMWWQYGILYKTWKFWIKRD